MTADFPPPTDNKIPNPFSDYLADDARVWSMYLDLTKSKGEELMRVWNSDLDTILIFVGYDIRSLRRVLRFIV